jgi:two-component system sensor histidine kinase KdpD
MADRRDLLLREDRPPAAVGVAVALLGVAAATGVIFGLRQAAPVLSLGLVYLLVVLGVSAVWGLWLGLATSVVSALAYNFFHIPPTGRFTIAVSENWVALVSFFVVAVAVSAISELARERAVEAQQRRQEADLSAAAARALLGGADLSDGLAETSRRLAAALGLPSAELVLGEDDAAPGRVAYPLRQGDRTLGTLILPAAPSPGVDARLRERIAPALVALLAAALEPDERVELSAAVVEEGARLERLIEKLLDLSRLQAGEAAPRLDWVDVGEVLAQARLDLVNGDLVKLQLDRDLPPVRADAAQLERAFSNLMENAIAHGGYEQVSVRARAVGPRLVIRVVDRGPGIPAAEQRRIFEPFYRGARDGERPVGSGLGLAIVRGFVQANGGVVRVESAPGQGAVFVVEFPLERDRATT